MITRIDVIDVASRLGFTLTESEIEEVLAQYPTEQDNDLSATWNLVVENCIYNVINLR